MCFNNIEYKCNSNDNDSDRTEWNRIYSEDQLSPNAEEKNLLKEMWLQIKKEKRNVFSLSKDNLFFRLNNNHFS